VTDVLPGRQFIKARACHFAGGGPITEPFQATQRMLAEPCRSVLTESSRWISK
jgi:hypothetical protein